MIENRFKHGLGVVALMLFQCLVSLNLSAVDHKYYQFKSYSTKDGLAHNYVMSIVQDTNNFIWIASIEGLSRYDGYDFVNYRSNSEDTASLSDNIIRKLYVDKLGRLWVGTLGGLCRYDYHKDNFIRYKFNTTDGSGLNDNEVYDISEDSKHNLWIATYEGGLNRYDYASNKFEYFTHTPGDTQSIAGNSVLSVYVDGDDNVWAGLNQIGITVLPSGSQHFINQHVAGVSPAFSLKFVPQIFQVQEGQIFLASGQGLVQLLLEQDGVHIKKSRIFNPPNESLKTNVVHSAALLPPNQLFTGFSISGIYMLDTQSEHFVKYNDINQPGQSFISNSIFVSADRTVWVGMKDKGIKRYNSYADQFLHYKHLANVPLSLSEDIVLSFYHDTGKGLWVGTQNGLNYLRQEDMNDRLYNFKQYYADPSQQRLSGLNVVNAIYKDSYGYFWLGTQPGILIVKQEQLYRSNNIDLDWYDKAGIEPTGSIVWSIVETRNQDIWAATENGVIRYYNRGADGKPKSHKRFLAGIDKENEIASNRVKTLAVDSRGALWAGTMEGLCLYTGAGAFKTFLKGYAIRCIIPDESLLYIGTEGRGLIIYNTLLDKYEIVNTSHGLPSNTVWGIIKDEENNLWLTTSNGLVRYNLSTQKLVNFYSQHGLQANEFKTGAFLKGSDKRFYIGGVNGFNAFYPHEIEPDTSKPVVHLTGLSIFNKPVLPGAEVKGQVILEKNIGLTSHLNLSYKHKVFTIGFTAINFLAPELCTFEYKLEGFDEDWIRTDIHDRKATYTNLNKGNYVFRVRAYNSHGVASANTIRLHLHITPPIWNTIGFYIVMAIVFLLAGYLILITRERHARIENERLTYERDLLQLLMDNIPDNIFFKDDESRFLRVNKGLAKFVGKDKSKELLGMSDFDFFPREFADITYNDEKKLFATSEPLVNKLEHLVWPNGEEVFLIANKVPIYDIAGNLKGLVGISRDITQQKRHEQELEKAIKKAEESDMLKTAFLANMSHEIRTPMNAILGFLSLLDEPDTKPDIRKEYRSIIQSNGETLLKLIDDIIDISLIESGQLKLTIRECSVSYLVSNLVKEYTQKQLLTGNSKVTFTHIKNTDQKLLLQTDEHRLRQIIVNFLENAYKFTKEGTIELGLDMRSEFVQIFVRDTGIGIDPDKHEKVFERFMKIENKKDKLYRGTGLGLFISKRLADMLGFTVGVESTLGNGARFWLQIPMSHIQGSSQKLVVNKQQIKVDFNWNDKCILLVEDEYSNFLYIEGLLRKTGIQLIHATDGYEAVNMFHANSSIDLILMDIKLPKMDGIEATKIIRGFNAEIPIIAQTAYAFKAERERIVDAGCDDYLPKPISRQKLFDVLAKYLDA